MAGVVPLAPTASSPAARDTEQAFIPEHAIGRRLVVSTWQFRIIWVVFVAITLANSLLATAFAAVYYGGLVIRDGVLIESVGLIDISNIPIVIAVYLATAVAFWVVVLRVLYASIVRRRLTLRVGSDDVRVTMPSASCWYRVLTTLDRWWANVIGTFRLELSQEAFEALFLAREILEIATQSYQAYKASRLITAPLINAFYAGAIALNCWCTPLIHVLTRRDAVLQRFWFVWIDILLDFVSAITIPVWVILASVLVVFRDSTNRVGGDIEYAFEAPYDDVVLMNQIRSVQQVFVLSWVDFATKMLPFASMLGCLLHVQGLVRRQEELWISQRERTKPSKSSNHLLYTVGTALRRRLSAVSAKVALMPAQALPHSGVRWRAYRVLRSVLSPIVVHALIFAWGVVVLGLHLRATRVSATAPVEVKVGCKSEAHPCFVSQFSCMVLEINCNRRGISGQATEIDDAISLVEPEGVGFLVITHCTDLHVPPRIKSLRNVIGVELTNVTLASWGDEASLDNDHHPYIQFATIALANMTAVPLGLQSRDFPRRLRTITISSTNLTALLDDLHLSWRRMLNLYLEHSLLSSVPIVSMRAARLSLFANAFTSFDSADWTDSRFRVLSVARNTLVTTLPASIRDASELEMLFMDYTGIAELPSWLIAEGAKRVVSGRMPIRVSAGGSAWCLSSSPSSSPPLGLTISCRLKPDISLEGLPLDFHRHLRRP
ncbi:hypothetical protein PINS_up005796 [Pythium insidiosum]|nr:hypothetical protein PINS_up005796 [Pythium insidiosum]